MPAAPVAEPARPSWADASDDAYLATVELHGGPLRDRLVEGDPVGAIDDVDPQGRNAYLQHAVVAGEVGFRHLESGQGRAESR